MFSSYRRVSKSKTLSPEAMGKIHEQSLYLLENIGIRIEHEKGLSLMAEAGADVNFDKQMVKFPSTMVENALKQAPRKIILGARNLEKDMVLEPDGRLFARNTGGMDRIYDYEENMIKKATLTDTSNFTKLADALDNIDAVAPLYATETPPKIRELLVLEKMIENTSKHVNIRTLSKGNLVRIAKIAEVVAGSKKELSMRPPISILEAPITPLTFPDVFIDAMLICGEYKIPLEICSMPIIGATGPITLAGCILLTTTELLASYVFSQIAYPGTPIIWAPRYVTMDMATGISGHSVESVLLSAASVQLATEYYNLVCDSHGPGTNSLIPDGESILDSAYRAFIAASAGPNIVTGVGTLETGLVASLEQLVIDNDIIGIVHRALAGFEVDDEHLGVEAICRVGVGGNFLSDEHTVKYLRDERVKLQLSRPKTRDAWISEGSKGIIERANEQVQYIIKEHNPMSIDKDKAKAISEIIADSAN